MHMQDPMCIVRTHIQLYFQSLHLPRFYLGLIFFLGGGGASVLHCMYVFCTRHDCSLMCVLYVYIHQGVFHNDEGGGG